MSQSETKAKKKGNFAQAFPMILYVLVGIICGFLFSEYLFREENEAQNTAWQLLQYVVLLGLIYVTIMGSIVVHELGHLVFGLLTGYRFVSFRVGALTLLRDAQGHYRMARIRVAGTGGQCLLSPPDLVDGKMPVVWYNLGGCVFNAICGVLFLVLFFVIGGPMGILRIFFMMVGLFNVAILLTNGIPLNTGLIANDGANARSARDPRAVRALWLQLKINEQMNYGVRLREMPEEWFEGIGDEEMKNPLTAAIGVIACNRLIDQGRLAEADAKMAHLLEIDSAMIGLHRQMLICERMFCEMIGENRPAVIDEMRTPELLKFMKMMRTSPTILRVEYAYAILTDFDQKRASELLAQFERFAAKYPYPQDIEGERELLALAEKKRDEAEAGRDIVK